MAYKAMSHAATWPRYFVVFTVTTHRPTHTKRDMVMFLFFIVLVSHSFCEQRIAVLLNKDLPQYRIAETSFYSALKKQDIGYLSKKFIFSDSDNSFPEIMSFNPDLVFTLGTSATRISYDKLPKNIPIVYSMVLESGGGELRQTNMVGVTLDIPFKLRVEELRRIFLKENDIVGIIYNVQENEAVVQNAHNIANSMGLALKSFPINTVEEMPKIEDVHVTYLLLIPDRLVCQNFLIKRILVESIKLGIPVIGISAAYTKSGAVVSIYPDYNDVGYQSGQIAAMIFKGKSPDQIATQQPRKVKYSINIAVADLIGLNISKQVIDDAEEVFGK